MPLLAEISIILSGVFLNRKATNCNFSVTSSPRAVLMPSHIENKHFILENLFLGYY